MPTDNIRALIAIKVLHTLVWAVFAGAIVALPFVAWAGHFQATVWLIVLVAGESAVLLLNRWTCPLTTVARRYTDDRRDNFDIYLPLWLARHNKLIFGGLYVAGIIFTLACWLGRR